MHVAVGAIKELFHQPTDVFWTGKVMDLLFNGIEIDCNSTEPLAKVTCNQIRRAKNPTIQPMENKRLKFSLLGGVCQQLFCSIAVDLTEPYIPILVQLDVERPMEGIARS